MILDQPVSPNHFIVGRPSYIAIAPPFGRRFVTHFLPRVLREQLNITKSEAIAIALDNDWVILTGLLHLNGDMRLTLRFTIPALKPWQMYRAVQNLLELLYTRYNCWVKFQVITSKNPLTVDEQIVHSLTFVRLQLFHYYNKN